MRRSSLCILITGVLAMGGLMPAQAAGLHVERSLLGIYLLRNFRSVLDKFGSPSEIISGGAVQQGNMYPGMGMTGMTPGMPGGYPMMPGGYPTMPGSAPYMGGSSLPTLPGLGGPGTIPGMPTMPGTTMGGGGLSYVPGGAKRGGIGMGGIPGLPPSIMGASSAMPGMPPYMTTGSTPYGLPGMPGTAYGAQKSGASIFGSMSASTTGTEPGEQTWIYKTKNDQYEKRFLFNKDGRVIQIQVFGYSGPGETERGVRLGDPLSKVFKLYGWTSHVQQTGDTLYVDYRESAHAAFNLLDLPNGKGFRVVGITIAITE
ncbi:MAG: hypothetical protein M1330_02855 [Armatimonadetes bacterium]|nr:hypothetical protein [Armatimonadota bacterium]